MCRLKAVTKISLIDYIADMYKHFDILIIFILKVVMMFLSINILFDFDIDWLAD